jgi:hypothetical protein
MTAQETYCRQAMGYCHGVVTINSVIFVERLSGRERWPGDIQMDVCVAHGGENGFFVIF